MRKFNAAALANKRVLLRSDLNTCLFKKGYERSHQLKVLSQTIRSLLELNCHVRLLISKGDPFSKVVDTTDIGHYLTGELRQEFEYCPLSDLAKDPCKLGHVTLLPNSFLSTTDKDNDNNLTRIWIDNIDVVVLDNHHFLDANYASSHGILNSGLDIWMGPYLSKIVALQETLKHRKVGLILGGEDVAWQIELAQSLSQQLQFIALGHILTAACVADDSYDPLFDQSVVQHLNDFSAEGVNVLYPTEVLAYHEKLCRTRVCLLSDTDADERVKDICLKTVQRIYSEINHVDLVIFSGVIGQYEDPRFHKGTELLLNYLSQHRVEAVLLGSDIIHAAACIGKLDDFSYLIEGSAFERCAIIKQAAQSAPVPTP
ncbi:phosphoglycerate kinase [Gammaproteobacteria bacterium]|nr:phosphoglycerate kinase [Gammaproteobacteria bacterium]